MINGGLWEEDKYKSDEGHGYRKKPKKIDVRIKYESIEQVDSFKYLGCNISSNQNCCQEVEQNIAMKKEAFNRALGKRNTEETIEVLCVECSVVWCRDLDSTAE